MVVGYRSTALRTTVHKKKERFYQTLETMVVVIVCFRTTSPLPCKACLPDFGTHDDCWVCESGLRYTVRLAHVDSDSKKRRLVRVGMLLTQLFLSGFNSPGQRNVFFDVTDLDKSSMAPQQGSSLLMKPISSLAQCDMHSPRHP